MEETRDVRRPAISVRDLTKTFPPESRLGSLIRRKRTVVLTGMSLEVFGGEIVGLLGPNGAGKTTLLEILATLLLPTSGQARIWGYDVVREAAEVKKLVGYCPSAAQSFYPRLGALENLEFFAALNNLPPRQARERVGAVLDLMGIDGQRQVPFQRSSEGMKQRLSLARALLADPPVLLLDEPTKSLDPLWQGEVRRVLRGTLIEKLGKTVLLVTHSLAEAEEVCDRLAILHRGAIVCAGTPREVREALGGGDLALAFEKAVEAGR